MGRRMPASPAICAFCAIFRAPKPLIRFRNSAKNTILEKVIFAGRCYAKEALGPPAGPRKRPKKAEATGAGGSAKLRPCSPSPLARRRYGGAHPVIRYTMSNIKAARLTCAANAIIG